MKGIVTVIMILSALTTQANVTVFDSGDLLAGFEARHVVAQDGTAVLDKRVPAPDGRVGTIVTDVIDVGPTDGLIALPAKVQSLQVKVDADVVDGTSLEIAVRTGDRFFDQSAWSEWSALTTESDTLESLKGRYAQVRLVLKGDDSGKSPAVRRLEIIAQLPDRTLTASPLRVEWADLQNIVRSPVEFHYERPDQPKIAAFRKNAKLDAVVSGASSDFEQLVALMDWVGHCKKDMQGKKHKTPGFYSWDLDDVLSLPAKEGDVPVIHGHCMSYAEVLISAATAFGFKGRHLVKHGFRDASHEITEIWVPSAGKWIYFDPSLSSYYFDKTTGEPLNQIELHSVVARNFVPDGKDMNWLVVRSSSETRDSVRRVGGKNPIGCRLGPWSYGEPMKPDYDWGYYHGYLASGFIQMTPRNDFHSNPDANPKKFEHYPGYGGYPNWLDDKTPVKKTGRNVYTRMRDFYWTLDQASLRLIADPATPSLLQVEFGNSMPFFARYQVTVNGKPVESADSGLIWEIKPGKNTLSVAPVDEFGRVGAGSTVTVVSRS